MEFNAWIAFRALAMLVLANDGWTYTLLAIRCWQPANVGNMWDGLRLGGCFVGGWLLVGLCCWVKASAHDCVGDFAWYWGDFFFKVDGSFTSSGVFRFFPHPMYTVGYSAYYGLSLVARSYTLLVVSLVAHLGQIAFLILVEEPHMEKIYGNKSKETEITSSKMVDTDDEHSQVKEQKHERPKEMMGLANFNVFRSSDFALAIMLLTTVGTSLFAPVGKKFHIAQLLFWWVLHWIGLGTILRLQSTSRFWTRYFEKHGMTCEEAYTHWKRIFNFSATMSKTAFVLAIISFGRNPFIPLSSFFSAKSLSHLGCGVSLILMSMYCSVSVRAALGSFGYFYGDFFIVKEDSAPTYSHIYQYTNNAELLFGHLAHYGIALIMQSRPVLMLALSLHVLHLIFVYNVELPHFRRLYRSHRSAPALQESVSSALADLGERLPFLCALYTKTQRLIANTWTGIRTAVIKALVKGVKDTKRILVQSKRYLLSEKSRVQANVKNSGPYRKVLKIGKGVRDGVKRFDGEDIVKLLERSGVRIEYVDDCSTTNAVSNGKTSKAQENGSVGSKGNEHKGALRHRRNCGNGQEENGQLHRVPEIEVRQ